MPTADDKKPFLKIRNLTKKFGDFTALRDVSLDVYEGEFICFLGPSGCGKTTLLRAIAGLDHQTAGTIEQAGNDISNLPAAERDFGIVFQSYALFPNLTVAKNVAYGLENRKQPRSAIQARVAELLELVGMPEQGNKYPAQLSGGQQQRVALARALATSPGLLLLDEPLSALDAKVRTHLRHEVKMLQRRLGITTIMVTHDQEEALTMADRIVVMNQGVIDQVGTPVDIYCCPGSPFVADFVGTMNFLSVQMAPDGHVEMNGNRLKVGTDTATPPGPVILAFRPEDVIARDIDAATPNSFEATVEDLEFLGSFYRANLIAPGAGKTEILADFSINLVRDLAVKEGKSIRVALPAEMIRVYPRTEGAPGEDGGAR